MNFSGYTQAVTGRFCNPYYSNLVIIIFFMILMFPVHPGWKDPAPPEVQEISSDPVPPPRPHPAVKVHANPAPLSVKAIYEDWPWFMGYGHDAVSSETQLIKQWPAKGPAIVWELEKGEGYAAPSIAGNRLLFIHRVGENEKIECLHPESGMLLWDYQYPTSYRDRFGYGKGPRSSPVIDGMRVYTLGAEGKLNCLDLETGGLYWSRNLAQEFKVPQGFFGWATTPIIDDANLIINLGAPDGPCVAAFDKISGQLNWGTGYEWGASYASPVTAAVHGVKRLYVFAGGESKPPTGGLLCVDPVTGRLLSSYPWRSRSHESVNASNPVVVGDRVFVSASYQTGGVLLQVDPEGKMHDKWTTDEMGTHWNTSIYRDGYLYGFDGRHPHTAGLVCLDARTGKSAWRKEVKWEETAKINGKSRNISHGFFRGSLLWADGHFLCLGESGVLAWLDLSPAGYREIRRVALFWAHETWNVPVVSKGLVYIMQNQRDPIAGTSPRLICYDLRKQD
jgi:outer membrane protein assembly factor BamB